MPRLSDVQRGQAIEMLMQEQLQNPVARHFDVNVSTIERLVRRLRETWRLADRPRSGRPRVTSHQDRHIVVSHMPNDRRLTAIECALNIRGNHGRPINSKTARNRLRELGIRTRPPPPLCRSTPYPYSTSASYGLGRSTCSTTVSTEPVETSFLHKRFSIQPLLV